jgi:hypothetical protein
MFFDMQLLESSFDLMQNPLFSMQKKRRLDDANPFILNDAVASRIIKIDSLKVEIIP